jgi:hypothetical protein
MMNDIEVRLKCLELALSKKDPGDAIAFARVFADFVLGVTSSVQKPREESVDDA